MKKVFWVPEHLANSLSSSCVQRVCVFGLVSSDSLQTKLSGR